MKYIKFLFCSFILCIMFYFFSMTILNNENFSNLERRNLVTFPKFSFDKIFDEEFLNTLTTAFSDQLEHRNLLVKGYYLFQFQRYNGDVVIGSNNQLYASYQTVSSSYYSNLKNITKLVNEVADEVNLSGAKFVFLSIPRKDAVMTKDLPSSYISSDSIYQKSVQIVKNNINSNVHFIDAYDIFKNNENVDSYFLNDHHITPRGGELLYREIVSYINNYDNILFYSIDGNYDIKKVIVNGSFNRQIGQSVKSSLEELILIPKYNVSYTRYENEKESSLSVFGEGNDYEVAYMGGDKAWTIIDTNREHLPNVLYVGSSFTNILEALSVPSFNKMISIDYRHNNSGLSIRDYVEKYDIDYVIFVPSQSVNAFSISMMKEHLGK